MEAFLPTHQTPVLVLFNIILLFLLIFTLKDALYHPHMVSLAKYRFALSLCVIFCLFSFWGTDWFHYLELFPMLQSGERGHMEEVYVWIVQNLSPNYLLFRLIIWGGAFFLFIKTLNRLDISVDLALLLFVIFSIIWFSYARATLAMTIIYFAGEIMFRSEKRFISLIQGTVLLCFSAFFHKSAIMAIPLVYIAYLFNVNTKLALRITLLFFPIIVIFAKAIVNQLMSVDLDNSNNMILGYVESGQNRLLRESNISGWGAIIRNTFERMPYYLIAFVGTKILIYNIYDDDIPSNIKSFIILQILIVVVSTVFLFDLNANTQMLYGRFLRYNAIPTVIVMTYLYELGIYRRLIDATIYIAGFGSLYTVLYAMYDIIINSNL